jgi:CHAT domain
MIKVLFLASDPTDTNRLRLGQELRDIRERLQLAKLRDSFVLESRESVRPRDISQAIFDVNPRIVHFSGHGTSLGELCFEDFSGKAQTIAPEALASLFELVAEQIRCVVLNACYSEPQAKAITEHIPFVVGMNKAIGDTAAIAFAVGFYKALGAGRSYEDAYKFGCVELNLEGIPEHLTPVLHKKKASLNKEQLLDISQISEADNTSTINFTLIYTETGAEYIVRTPSNIRAQTVVERLLEKITASSSDSHFLQNFKMYDWNLFIRKNNSLRRVPRNLTLQSAQIQNGTVCELHADIKSKYLTIRASVEDMHFFMQSDKDGDTAG